MLKYEGNKLCSYGCGNKAKYFFNNVKKYCCSTHFSKCPVRRKQSKDYMTGLRIGNKNPRFGIKMSEKLKQKISKTQKYSINQIRNKFPLFAKIEEMRYEPGKEKLKVIQVHCKNHNCKNSKEQGGWFTPKRQNIIDRYLCLEKEGSGGSYFYCSEECKQSCTIYGKTIEQLIIQDKINDGHLIEPWYTSNEYQTWRQQVFELDDNKCVYCGKQAKHVHHILPQKTHPELSLDPENGISCCVECHFKYGHKDYDCNVGNLKNLVCDRIYKNR